LLGNLKTNRERVILPSSQAKLRKNTLFIDQSAFSNFALYVIRALNSGMKPIGMLKDEMKTCKFVTFLSWLKILPSCHLHIESNTYM